MKTRFYQNTQSMNISMVINRMPRKLFWRCKTFSPDRYISLCQFTSKHTAYIAFVFFRDQSIINQHDIAFFSV